MTLLYSEQIQNLSHHVQMLVLNQGFTQDF